MSVEILEFLGHFVCEKKDQKISHTHKKKFKKRFHTLSKAKILGHFGTLFVKKKKGSQTQKKI